MNEDKQLYDITVIGGGPAGLFTAFYGGLRNATVKIIESLPHLGGQLTALYPEKYIYDVAGFPKIRAQELVDNLTEQIKMFDPTVCLDQSVQTVEKLEDGTFKLSTDKEVHYTKTIIITAGNGAFKPRTMKLQNEETFKNTNLFYRIENINDFKDKDVVIFGGGDSAVDWALMLEPIAKQVSIVHRRNQFRAHEHSVELLKISSVEIITPFIPVEIKGEKKVDSIIIKQMNGDETLELKADAYIVNYGYVSNLGPISNWGLKIDKNSIVVNSKMETNIPGIYAVGDIATYDGKVKLMATGFGEAPIAVSHAKQFIDPSISLHTIHSTSLMSRLNNVKKTVINQ